MASENTYITWNLKASKALVGKTIASVHYLTRQEATELDLDYWDSMPLVIVFTDGTSIMPTSDDECNDGGAITFVSQFADADHETLLPTL
jgi:hypothetical protein